MGVGEAFIDHAAGMPLSSRQPSTSFAMSSVAYAPPSSPRSTESRRTGHRQQESLGFPRFPFVDDPVELPLRSRTRSYVMMGAVIAAFLAVFLTVVLSGSRVAPSAAPSGPPAPAARPAG